MANRTITATEFKSKCLALLDEVNQTGDTLTITKRGVQVATVEPPPKNGFPSSEGILAGMFPDFAGFDDKDFQINWNFERRAKLMLEDL